jgi:hypothetical protein
VHNASPNVLAAYYSQLKNRVGQLLVVKAKNCVEECFGSESPFNISSFIT